MKKRITRKMRRELRKARRQLKDIKKRISEDERLMMIKFMRETYDKPEMRKLVIFNSNERI